VLKKEPLQVLIFIFSLLWIFVVGIDYLNKHPLYALSFEYFEFPKYAAVTLVSALIYAYLTRLFGSSSRSVAQGVLLLPILSQITITVLAFKDYSFMATSYAQCLTLVGRVVLVGLVLLLLSILFSNVGSKFTSYKRVRSVFKSNYYVDIGVGIIFYTFLLFALGSFGILSSMTVIGALLLMLALRPINFFVLVKKTFLTPIDFNKINPLGAFLLYLLISYLVINFISVQTPFPDGFDSKNLYINISKLVSDSGSLVSGFRPYNWSLLMSTGFFLYDWVELVIGLSFYGYILSMLVLFHLATNTLKLKVPEVVFSILLVTVSPAITNQLFIEFKVDYGLLFFQLLSVYFFMSFLGKGFEMQSDQIDSRTRFIVFALFTGGFLGFGLGIKMINLFLVMTLISLVWLSKDEVFGFLGALALTIAAMLIARVDTFSGLNDYHLGVGRLKIILLVCSLVLFGLSYFKNKIAFKRRAVFTILMVFFAGLFLSPWLIKNIVSSENISMQSLISGENKGLKMGTQDIIKTYQESQKKK